MKSFKEIIEVKRDEKRAMKLWGYLARRHEKYKGMPVGYTKLSGYDKEDAKEVDKHYDNLNKTSKEGAYGVFMKAPVSEVPVSSLKLTQNRVRFNKREKWKMSDDDPIFVLKKGDKHLVVDGHHRVVAWKMQGRKNIKAHVIELKETPQIDYDIGRDWGQENMADTTKDMKKRESKKYWKKIHDTGTHEIWKRSQDVGGDKYTTYAGRNKKTKRVDIVSGGFASADDVKAKRFRENTLAARRGNKLKAQDFYHAILGSGDASEIHSDTYQSPGARKVWKRFAAMDDVKMDSENAAAHYKRPRRKARKELKLRDFETAYTGKDAGMIHLIARLREGN